MLRAAQAVRFPGGIKIGLRAVGPDQPPQRGFVDRGERSGRGVENAAFALDHDRAHFGQARAHQRDPGVGIGARHVADPLRPGTRLAKSATGADQPDSPVARRRVLFVPAPHLPMPVQQGLAFVLVEHEIEVGAARPPFRPGAAEPVAARKAPTPIHGGGRLPA